MALKPSPVRIKAGTRAFSWHLLISALVACGAAALVLGVWFPYPYRSLAGGQHLFWLMIVIDVICGPLLTGILYNPAKSRRELTLDLSLVALVQLGALAYGLHSINLARPVIVAHEVDRFVAVTTAELDPQELSEARPEYRIFPLFSGPRVIGTRLPKDGPEMLHSVELSMSGKEPSVRPGWWQPYADSLSQVQQRMKQLAELRAARKPDEQAAIDAAVARTGKPVDKLFYLPLTSRKMLDGWIVLLDADAQLVGYAPVDGF